MIEGVDVSASSGPLDYDAIAASKAFVYHKATDGVNTLDRKLMERTNALRSVGMGDCLGAYHFLRVRHEMRQDSDEQCKQFMDARANAQCSLPPWFDVELGEPNSSNRKASKDEVRAACELFWETWDKCLGGSCLPFYSSPFEMMAMGTWQIPKIIAYPLALAEYTGADKPKLPPPFTSWMFWQWAGDVAAFGGIVDMVRFNGSIDDLIAL